MNDDAPMLLAGSDIDWGNAPSWVAATAAIVAVVFASRSWSIQRTSLRMELGKIARAQAEAVWAYIAGLPLWASKHELSEHAKYAAEVRLVATNGHPQPIWEIRVEAMPVSGNVVLQPGIATYSLGGPNVLKGGELAIYESPYLQGLLASSSREWDFHFWVYFRDSAGRRWVRRETGELEGPLELNRWPIPVSRVKTGPRLDP